MAENNFLDVTKLSEVLKALHKDPNAQLIGCLATDANTSYDEAMFFYLHTTGKCNNLDNLLQSDKDGRKLRLYDRNKIVYCYMIENNHLINHKPISNEILAQFPLTEEGKEFIKNLLGEE